jgi:lipopolysaccharide/colanic/teichoic acid biosynthesis glycosyltransferase
VKPVFDFGCSAMGLLLLSPLFLLLALLIKVSDGGPVFYRQTRVGQYGEQFRIWKFRTMVMNADRLGPGITKDGDPRVTRVGRFLRKTKLDELPQLFNVLAGEMSLVGPRPELPKYVAQYTPQQRQVLALIPGITDVASIEFRNEEEMLAAASDTEDFYVTYCIPKKIALNLAYAARAKVWEDTKVILRTVLGARGRHTTEAPRHREGEKLTLGKQKSEIETLGIRMGAEDGEKH